MKSVEAIELIVEEFGNSARNNPPFLSQGDGLAAISDEMDKLTDELLGNPETQDKEVIKDAAVKTAANAFRFLVDLC